MPDLNDQIRRYIEGLGDPVTLSETMARPPRRRRIALKAALAGAAVVLIPALVLVIIRGNPGPSNLTVAASTTSVPAPTVPPTTPTTPTSTSVPPVVVPVAVPDVVGLDIAGVRALAAGLGLELEVTERFSHRDAAGLIQSQFPEPGVEVDPGTVLEVEVAVTPACDDYRPDLPPRAADEMDVVVQFECAADYIAPDVSTPVVRRVPAGPGVIQATLRALLAGPTDDERAAGFGSFFSPESAGALESVTLDAGKLTVDFNDAILINNASTSTGGMYFTAELLANLFQFDVVDSIEFRLNGSCASFWGWLQGECVIVTRADWEARVARWQQERAAPHG